MPAAHVHDSDHEFVPAMVLYAVMPTRTIYAVRVDCPCGRTKTYVNVPAQASCGPSRTAGRRDGVTTVGTGGVCGCAAGALRGTGE